MLLCFVFVLWCCGFVMCVLLVIALCFVFCDLCLRVLFCVFCVVLVCVLCCCGSRFVVC